MGSFYFFSWKPPKNWIFDLQKSVNFELGNLFKKNFFEKISKFLSRKIMK